MTTRERLHHLIDHLPEGSQDEAERRILALFQDEMRPEDVAWMESDLSDFADLEPYEWGPEGPPTVVNPVYYLPGVGLVVEERGDNPPT